ncbi:MAG: DUF1552 domain-containing protein [Acidobacteria bacterium]|nr:DUF1552 domain-containing protein [Acidobacteriota bacterium]
MMALNRRTLLRGMAASVALPYLEAMSPARTSAAEAPKRFIALFQPNGVYPPAWDVRGSGASYEFSPILEPLRVHRGDIQIISNLGTNAKGHVAATSAVLTGTPLQVTANDPAFVPRMGISIDQLLAQKLGQSTRIASLELGTEPPRAGGENNLPISFASTVSWSGPSTKVDPEISPRAVFDRLFGAKDARQAALENKSLLDRILEDSKRLSRKVSAADKRKLDEYLTSVRDVEKRVERTLAPAPETGWKPLSKITMEPPPEGIPSKRDVHLRLMMDLLLLALQTDTTRVVTLMMAHGFSRQNFSFLEGVKGDHHSISHHKESPELTLPYTIVSRWYISQYAYLIERMKQIDEGGTSLLDRSIVLYACELRDGNGHTTRNLPIVLAGRAGGLKPGRHVALEANTPLANLHLTIAQRMGLELDKFNTSTGVLSDLA